MSKKRTVRILRFLIDLASGPAKTLDDAAGNYGVTARTLQRDISILRKCDLRIRMRGGCPVLDSAARTTIGGWMALEAPVA